jgi:hypothetical protein
MTSLEQATNLANAAPLFVQTLRQRFAAIPERIDQAERELTGFSVARIFTTFQIKRSEYFPGGVSDAAFDMLVDLFLYDCLNWRVGSSQEGGMRLAEGQARAAGIDELLEAGFVTLTSEDATKSNAKLGQFIALSTSGRARLNIFFDYMAEYISAM